MSFRSTSLEIKQDASESKIQKILVKIEPPGGGGGGGWETLKKNLNKRKETKDFKTHVLLMATKSLWPSGDTLKSFF